LFEEMTHLLFNHNFPVFSMIFLFVKCAKNTINIELGFQKKSTCFFVILNHKLFIIRRNAYRLFFNINSQEFS
jgi:hypothetical protein